MSEASDRIVHLRGAPFEIGEAMGRALGPRLEANIERYIRARVPRGIPPHAERWRSGALPWLRSLPARFREEFEGLAQGAGLPLQRLAERSYLEVIIAGGCSGAIVSLDGRAWVARNNDFIGPGLWGYAAIREVAGRIPTITFGQEGSVFTSTGINRERLWLHYNYLPTLPGEERRRGDAVKGDAGTEERGLPCYAFMVEALETCRSLEDVQALLGRIPRTGAMLLFAVDGKRDDYALYECTCSDFCKREATEGWIVGANHYVAHPQAAQRAGPEPRGPLSSGRRHRRLEELVGGLAAQGGAASPAQALTRILADDSIEARNGPTVTVYANVACPSTGEIWHTFGGCPAASRGNWQRMAWPW